MSEQDPVWNRLQYDRDGIIEASAGTGKTYALQRIVLKLVADGERPVQARNILLVTFTEKAAGELKDRIRDILSKAGQLPSDFDEMTICTIHSFCREILSEYAFENRVPMRVEIGGTNGDLIHRAVRTALLGDEFRNRYGETYGAFMDVAERGGKGRSGKKIESTEDLVAAAEAMLDECASADLPPEEPERTSAPEAEDQRDIAKSQMQKDLAFLAWPVFKRLKDDASVMTFDDLVTRAYRVIRQESERESGGNRSALLDSIRRRYRIALVDEFQDTNEKQWTIFRSLFSSSVNRISGDDAPTPRQGFLLVVGDPKQAIYSFQGADVATYLAAKREITSGEGAQKAQSLDKTYRSCHQLVEAFGKMFGEASGWFAGMKEGDERIEYPNVVYPEENERFAGLADLTGRGAVTLLESLPRRLPDIASNRGCPGYGNAAMCFPVFMRNAAREMKRLRSLDVAYRTTDAKTGKPIDGSVKYGDMCVLVRSNEGAKVVKRILEEAGVPYSHYKEGGIYGSIEAEALIAFFDFLSSPGRAGNLAALLMTPLFDVHPSMLETWLAGGDKSLAKLVERWQELSAKRSWVALFESAMNDTALAHPVRDDCEYDRRWTAFRQILDRLLAEKGRSALAPGEFAALLRSWRRSERCAGSGGTLRQRESDGDSVQIMTMHASKGLEFKAVFVASGFSKPKNTDTAEEERRLYYVALTRAEHKLYLPWTQWDSHTRASKGNTAEERGLGSVGSPLLGEGFLSRAIRACFENPTVVKWQEASSSGHEQAKSGTSSCDAALPAIYEVGGLRRMRLKWDSFSSLSRNDAANRPVPSDMGEADELSAGGTPAGGDAASLLPRNNISGNVFHEIMETLCGANEASGGLGFAVGKQPLETALAEKGPLTELVRRTMRRNALNNQERGGDTTERTLVRMVWRALNTRIEIGGRRMSLKDIPFADRLAEVEFVMDEGSVLGPDIPHSEGAIRDGAFNGSIDLLVRPDGRGGPVYVLDWKTNTLADYGEESVEAAMEAAGYPLQFKLYSLAVERWLGRGALAGVAYLFVRGGEHGAASGVYARAMDADLIMDCRKSVLDAVRRDK